MWIVRLALRRPYTFVVLSMLILLLGIGSAIETPKDIFPYINIPVVTIVWTYGGLTPTEMEGRIVTVCERALTTTVNDIEHSESESYQGVSVIRVYFQPTVKVELALSQITSIVQTVLRVLPPGTSPPAIIKYDASSVPSCSLVSAARGYRKAICTTPAIPPSDRGSPSSKARPFRCRTAARCGRSWSTQTPTCCLRITCPPPMFRWH